MMIFRRSKPDIFQDCSMKSSEPPLSFHKLDACFFFLRLPVGGACYDTVGSLDSHEMIFGIEESNSFQGRISYS